MKPFDKIFPTNSFSNKAPLKAVDIHSKRKEKKSKETRVSIRLWYGNSTHNLTISLTSGVVYPMLKVISFSGVSLTTVLSLFCLCFINEYHTLQRIFIETCILTLIPLISYKMHI